MSYIKMSSLAVGIAIIGPVLLGLWSLKSNNGLEEGVLCTLEAKICPDGSSVGRTGSACEFAPCPTEPLSSKAEYRDLIRVETPLPDSTISSPLVIRGEARGNWYFEASFPVVLTDWNGRIIAEGIAQAEGEWMTTDYVPFTAELTFKPDTAVSNRGSLILKKSNPSGLSENDDAFEFTVFFADKSPESTAPVTPSSWEPKKEY